MNKYAIDSCRSCGNKKLQRIIELGDHYISGFVSSKKEGGIRVPLSLILCNEEVGGCGLLQLEHNAPEEEMWDEQYWYKSSINPTIKNDLKDIVENVCKMISLKKNEIVLDIGCNDGTLLSYYPKNIRKVGFDPSKNVAEEARKKGFEVVNDFFNFKSFKQNLGNKKAKIITAISMFYDLEDPNSFLKDVNSCLEEDGLFVIQQNYLIKMLENNGIDNVCHEHREYYSLRSLKNLLERHNLEVFDLVLNDINGGSIRTYIRKKGSKLSGNFESEKRIKRVEKMELRMGLNSAKPYLDFAKRVDEIKDKIIRFMKMEKEDKKLICGSGASTKGNTILQYFGLGPELIKCIGDKNPDKEGKMTLGSWINITSPEKVDGLKPDYLFVLIWFFIEDLKKNHREFLEMGGKFIIPFPKPRIIEGIEGKERLILWASLN